MNWWIRYITRTVGNVTYNVSTLEINQFNEKPNGTWFGPFHCKECAELIANFGKTKEQAMEFVHPKSDDEQFCVFLSVM